MTNSSRRISIIAIALFAVLARGALAIKMSPASLIATGISIGDSADLGVPLVIDISGEGVPRVEFALEPLSPGKVGKTPAGYEPIPDPAVLFVEGEGPLIATESEPLVRPLKIAFPADSSLLNRHFIARLAIRPLSGGMFRTMAVGSYLIETASTPPGVCRPGRHPISLSPSVIDYLGEGSALLRIFNNDTVARTILVYPAVPGSSDSLGVRISRGFAAADPGEFEIRPNGFAVERGGYKDIYISLNNKEYRESLKAKSEVILWIRDPADSKSAEFARIRLHPDR